MPNPRILAGLAVVSAAFSLTAPAQAAPTTLCGPNICYDYDDAQAGISFFGSPSLSGDALIFLAPNFRAQSTDGASGGFDQAQASFVIDSVYALNGMALQYVGITEFGDYEIDVGDGVSAALDLDLVDNTSLESGMVSDLFTATGDSGGLQTWQIGAYYHPAMYFGPGMDVGLTITDTLTAETSEVGEDAWIQKKITLGVTTVVPLPAAAWLFLSGLGALGVLRRRVR